MSLNRARRLHCYSDLRTQKHPPQQMEQTSMEANPTQFTGARKALLSGLIAVTAICAAVPTYAQNLIPANAGFESSEPVTPQFSWPTTDTWRRGDIATAHGITPYTDSSNPQSGSNNVVLTQYTANPDSYFSLTFRGQPSPGAGVPTSTTSNLVPRDRIILSPSLRIGGWIQ